MHARRIFGALVAAGLALVSLSGCEPTTSTGGGVKPPEPEAQAYFDAWKNGDQAAITALAKSQTLVDKTLAVPYVAADDWLFIGCDTNYVYRLCRWVDRVENVLTIQVLMTVDRTNQKIGSFTRGTNVTQVAHMENLTKAFRAYRDDDMASVQGLTNAPGWAEYSALPKFKAEDEWGTAGCAQNPQYPSLVCTWKNKWNNAISFIATLDGVIYGAVFDQFYN